MTAGASDRPVSLRLSVTDRCPLRCLYCMPAEGVPLRSHEEVLRIEQMVRFVRVLKSCRPLAKVHITGGEPLIRRGILSLVEMLAGEGIADLAMTTNAEGLAERAAGLKQAGLRRINVSLDSLDPEMFATLTGGGELSPVLAGIDAAVAAGLVPVKLNTVVMKGHNDGEVTDLARWALDHGCAIRFLELMPIGCTAGMFRECFMPASEIRSRLAASFSLAPQPYSSGASSRDFRATDADGRSGIIGFIAPETQPFCDGCSRLRLTSTGELISCLARGKGPSVRRLLSDESPANRRALQKIIREALGAKRLRVAFSTKRAMSTVGG